MLEARADRGSPVTVTSLFRWMTPGELERFPVAERDRAIAWAAGDGD
ncbi:MAG: hypothetical protein ACXWXS_11025 [Actinomycetota bacterium]